MLSSKLSGKGKTKLEKVVQDLNSEKKTESLDIMSSSKSVSKNFRLRPQDVDRLSKILENLESHNPDSRFTSTHVIKALLLIGSEMDVKDLYDSVRKTII